MIPSVIAVKTLRPTQIAVGMKLVSDKRRGLRKLEKRPSELVDFILAHPIRVVLGPKDLAYIIDHHHLGLALLLAGFKTAPMAVEADLSHVEPQAFWPEMQRRAWVYPVDGKGVRRPLVDIPRSLRELKDDPYRSLAGMLREEGGFTKSLTPYAEFSWAEYFRSRIAAKLLKRDFVQAVKKAQQLAHLPEANALPGFQPQRPPKKTPREAQPPAARTG